MPATAVYCRISKDVVGEHLGVDRQERLCRTLAAERGLEVVDVLVDNDASAFDRRRKRPGFDRLVDMMRSGQVSSVIAYHADRLYRRTADLERLVDVVESCRTDVFTVAAGDIDLSTASGRMVARMLGAAAQHESERTSERAKDKHDELANKGKPPGGRPPFGYSWGTVIDANGGSRRSYVVNRAEAEALRTMARRILEGASLLAVAREMDAAGVTTREGRPWHHSTVRAVLTNPAVAALRVHRREVAGSGDWEPILDRPTWEELRAVIADPARKRTRPARRYLLAGMVENENGDQMNGRPDRAADGTMTRRTYATRAPASPSLAIGADDLEALVVGAALAALEKAALPEPDEKRGVGDEIAAIEAELLELADLRGKGAISLAEWMAAREPLQRRLEAAKASATVTRRPSPMATMLRKPGAVRRAWPALGFAEQREVIAALVERVVIKRASRGRWTPMAERVEVVWKV